MHFKKKALGQTFINVSQSLQIISYHPCKHHPKISLSDMPMAMSYRSVCDDTTFHKSIDVKHALQHIFLLLYVNNGYSSIPTRKKQLIPDLPIFWLSHFFRSPHVDPHESAIFSVPSPRKARGASDFYSVGVFRLPRVS